MARLTELARATYRDRCLRPDEALFPNYFRAATCPPIDVIEPQCGSDRAPASRAKDRYLRSAREFHGSFAWGQSRHALPGWFGLGSGLARLAEEIGDETLKDHGQSMAVPGQSSLEDAEMAMAKADMNIARNLCRAWPGELGNRYFPLIRQRVRTDRADDLPTQGPGHMLDRDPTLNARFCCASPYVDPNEALRKSDLLARWRRRRPQGRRRWSRL